MKWLWFSFLLPVIMVGALSAQEPSITPNSAVNSDALHQWLHSNDPRQIAWAADFARRTHDAKIVAEMPALLEHWTMPVSFGGDESQAAQRRAMIAVLDTLIQENVQVPIPAIKAVAEFYPASAIILISRLPASESRSTLEDWTYGATGSWSERTLARVASMILAKEPGASRAISKYGQVGFVASVLGASEEELQITIRSEKGGARVEMGNGCGDYLSQSLSPGWPQVYKYDLVENDPQAVGLLVVDLDGDRIVSRRFEENRPLGSCYGVQGLNSFTRHKLIAYWLGMQWKDMPWQPVESFTIVWTDKSAYQRQLGELIETQRNKLQTTVAALRQRNLLSDDEAARIAPRLVVSIQCKIEPCPLH